MGILVTGGVGFIGSHTCVELLHRGYDVVVVDDYSNSSPAALAAVRDVTGKDLITHELDLRDEDALDRVFSSRSIDAVIHFAAKKYVRESVQIPLGYYGVNVGGTISLVSAMLKHHVDRLVFSSSCSIYGSGHNAPISEDAETRPTNPYARSKLMCEQILADACHRYPDLSVIALRYFNPIGGHTSGALGEDPRGAPSNILPYMMQVAAGRREYLEVYADDYDTPDGSGVRDYIHVLDVAEAHCAALGHLGDESGKRAFNLGTGTGVSVFRLRTVVQEISGREIPYRVTGRQPGDVGTLIADPSRVEKLWGWHPGRDLIAMCSDAWRFQRLHPNGYAPLAPGLAEEENCESR